MVAKMIAESRGSGGISSEPPAHVATRLCAHCRAHWLGRRAYPHTQSAQSNSACINTV